MKRSWPGSSNPMFCGGGSSYPTGWWWFHHTTPIFEPLGLYGNGMGPAVVGSDVLEGPGIFQLGTWVFHGTYLLFDGSMFSCYCWWFRNPPNHLGLSMPCSNNCPMCRRAFTLNHKCCIETWLQVSNGVISGRFGDFFVYWTHTCCLHIEDSITLVAHIIYRCSELDFNFATCLHFLFVKITHGIMTACSKEKGPHQTQVIRSANKMK